MRRVESTTTTTTNTRHAVLLSSPLFFHSALPPSHARALIGFSSVPARSGPPQHGPADAAKSDLVAAGAALAPHAAVPAFIGGLRRGVELVSGIRQIRARRRRQQWWGPPWRPRCRSTSRSSSYPHGVSGEKGRGSEGKFHPFDAFVWFLCAKCSPCAGASWWCAAMGGRRRSRQGR